MMVAVVNTARGVGELTPAASPAPKNRLDVHIHFNLQATAMRAEPWGNRTKEPLRVLSFSALAHIGARRPESLESPSRRS